MNERNLGYPQPSNGAPLRALVVGASGAIGGAMTQLLEEQGFEVLTASRSGADYHVDIADEASIANLGEAVIAPFDLVFIATGALHNEQFKPEKSLRDLSADAFNWQFQLNTIAPALLAKALIPKLQKNKRAVFAVLSARVGSISDDRLGGWYAYRASKAALNMTLKNLAIETKRTRPEAVILGLHPGTVASPLSSPFQANVPKGKLFTPEQSAGYLFEVLATRTPADSGKVFDWKGEEIAP